MQGVRPFGNSGRFSFFGHNQIDFNKILLGILAGRWYNETSYDVYVKESDGDIVHRL